MNRPVSDSSLGAKGTNLTCIATCLKNSLDWSIQGILKVMLMYTRTQNST